MNRFDEYIERRGTGSLKWDLHPELVPYWVADMDFKAPDCVLQALHQRVDHGVFGYALGTGQFNELLTSYFLKSHGVHVESEWIVHMGGCVPALATAVLACCSPGESIMTCSPVYPPIRSVHACAHCGLVEVPHVFCDGQWTFDWEAMEKAVAVGTKMFILCNPQNPLGRVFSRRELMLLADFCERHALILCADEIHCDLVLDPHVRHQSALGLPGQYLKRLIVLASPSKTYNIAGIGYSMAVIPDPGLRASFEKVLHLQQPPVHCLAFTAAEAAYRGGEEWRQELLAYLRVNRDCLYEWVRAQMPRIVMHPMQATYLAWMDLSSFALDNAQQFLMEKAGVFLNAGEPFGSPHCVRFNLATSREHMMLGLQKMAAVLR